MGHAVLRRAVYALIVLAGLSLPATGFLCAARLVQQGMLCGGPVCLYDSSNMVMIAWGL